MTIKFSKRFRKQFQILKPKEKDRFWSRVEILKTDPLNKLLNHHILKGSYSGWHSINIGGDLRALYLEKSDVIIIFELIGTHSQLYK